MFPFEETVPQMKLAIPSRGQSGKSNSSKLYLILQGGWVPSLPLKYLRPWLLKNWWNKQLFVQCHHVSVWFALLYCTGSLAGLRVLMHRRSLFFICFFCNNYILPSSICFLFIQYTKAMFFKIDLRISNLSSIVTPNLSYKNKQSLTKMEQYSEIRVFLVCMFKSKKNKND